MTATRSAPRLPGLALAVGLFALSGGAASAETAPTALDFELSDGNSFVRLSTLPPRITVINFWRSDCPPCLREMPMLAQLARQDKSRFVAIALQRPHETAAAPAGVLDALQPPLQALHGPTEPRGILARFGNPAGALPYTVVLDTQRRACARQIGEVTPRWLDAAIQRCNRT